MSDTEVVDSSIAINLTLRSYQITLVQRCLNNNSIIFLPTGSGKTFVALHVLKEVGDKITGSLKNNGKRALFLVPTRALVYQQARVLREITSFRIVEYTGDLNVDYWPRGKWQKEFEESQVFVMTPSIMQMILTHNYIRLDIFAIIIVDECHNGVDDHAYRAVMREQRDIPEELRPRIIGLTATLLNKTVNAAKVPDELDSLEKTFLSKIITCDELAEILKFSANPQIECRCYDPEVNDVLQHLLPLQEEVSSMCSMVDKVKNELLSSPSYGWRRMVAKTLYKTVQRAFADINEILNEMGVYGCSVAVLYHILQFEQKRMLSETEVETYLYGEVTSSLHQIRSLLMRILNDDESVDTMLSYCSPKVRTLLDLLKENAENKKESESISTLVFARRRSSCIVLAHILRKLATAKNSGFEFLKPSFLVGGRSNPLHKTRESLLERKWLQRTLKRFTLGELNTLVATSLLEEGVDFPGCNLVVRFDLIDLHYRSFIQCKGRARSKTGVFVILVPKEQMTELSTKLSNFQCIQDTLYQMLSGPEKERDPPTQESIEEDWCSDQITPYYVDGPGSPHVTGVTAISCIYSYCCKLPQDVFSNLSPHYFLKSDKGKKLCAVILPMPSPLRKLIQGEAMDTVKLAKRSAFRETVRLLHEVGELTDELKPRLLTAEAVDFQWLFPHFRNESSNDTIIGAKSHRRLYEVQHPKVLTGCLPTKDVVCYLHVLVMTPKFQVPTDNRRKVFHNLLALEQQYAILSTKRIPNVCDFPLYMSIGEITCQVVPNSSTVILSEEQIEQVAGFHLQLFSNVIDCVKQFMVLSRLNSGNAYYVVPVKKVTSTDCYKIDWDVVLRVDSLVSYIPVNDCPMVVDRSSHNLSIISPFYRIAEDPHYYVVTDVCENLTPLSPFPDSATETYLSYFTGPKYNAIIKNSNQPLLEVKKLPSLRGNFIRPRSDKAGGIRSRRKMLADGGDFDEHLVAELCHHYRYPATLWIKALLLPAALHRTSQLLFLQELHARIVNEVGVGKPPAMWAPLQSNPGSLITMKPAVFGSAMPSNDTSFKTAMTKVAVPAAALWDDENEPMNLCESMDKVADCDIKRYVEYAKKPRIINLNLQFQQSDGQLPNPPSPSQSINSQPTQPPPILKLKVLEDSALRMFGPELSELLAATTAKSANDIVNLERLETLGDSFLKFAASLFLFRQFPKMNEGELTSLKGKLVSNRNLLYCGQEKGLPALIQAQEFVNEEWVPPLCQVPNEILKVMKAESRNPGALFSMYVPYEERLSGKVKPKTLAQMRTEVLNADVLTVEAMLGRSLSFLQQKTLRDKGIADCVEALIGTYVMSHGIDAGFKLLNWFGLIPSNITGNPEHLMHTNAPSPLVQPNCDAVIHLKKIQYLDLEKTLGYHFREPGFLLQALTHPTFAFHRTTDCYQRLEFLGDAVLDFLVTCFIYQEGESLDPGQITMLRSALVNNTTFGCLTVRLGFHRYLLSICPSLTRAISSFVALQESRNHLIDEAVLTLLNEQDCKIAEAVEVPKALGDLFEALVAAIFLDSGNSLEAVWNVVYPIMKNELDTFLNKIPRNSVQLIHELGTQFNIVTTLLDISKVRCRVDVELPSGELASVYGFGGNKFDAKRSAAKLAMLEYNKAKEKNTTLV